MVLYEQYLIQDLSGHAEPVLMIGPRKRTGVAASHAWAGASCQKWALSLLIIFVLTAVLVGQTGDEDTNWYRELGRGYDGYSGFDFTRYTKSDIQLAKTKFLQIESDKSLDEWEGLYTRGTMLGRAELMWSRRGGFVYAYIYHTLAAIDYGGVVMRNDSILLVSDRRPPRKSSSFIKGEHVGVKFGDRHFLVQGDRLRDFALYAAGLEVPEGRREREIFTEEGFVWEKVGDEKKKLADVPVFPARFAHLVRMPIKSKVLSVGRVRVKRTKPTTTDMVYVDHLRSITLSAGSRQGVRVGMTFWIGALEERVEVVSVRPSRSVARLSRGFYEGKESCYKYEDYSQVTFPCREPKVGMEAQTKTEHF